MFFRAPVCSMVAGLLLSGCVNSFEIRERHTAKASRVYTAGSSLTGTGETLLLFPDGSWESWGSSCTETKRGSRGTYEISGQRIAFFREAGKTETLELFSHDGREYLGTREEQRAMRKDPQGTSEHFTLKRWK